MTQMHPPMDHPHPETSILHKMKLKKGHNFHNYWRILSYIKLVLYFMIIYLCIKTESNTLTFSKNIECKPFFEVTKKGYNSHNNWWILPLIELNIYFMIIYMCIKYETNTLIFSKDINWKPFFKVEKWP